MPETKQDVFFRIAKEHGLLTEEQASDLEAGRLASQGTDDGGTSVDLLAVEKGWLTVAQVRGIERGVRYYGVRKADKIYGKIAVELGLVDPETLANCLKKQKLDYQKRHTLPRLWKLFREVDALSADDDERVRALAQSRVSPRSGALEEPAVA